MIHTFTCCGRVVSRVLPSTNYHNFPSIGETLQPEVSPKAFVVAFVIAYCPSQIPIYLVEVPPLVDYPNHLARMAILADGGKSAVLREFYEIRWGFYPNLAMDLVVPPLSHIVGEVAGKLFISLVMLLLVSGTASLSIALHRRLTLWPLAAFLFLYNRSFLWDF